MTRLCVLVTAVLSAGGVSTAQLRATEPATVPAVRVADSLEQLEAQLDVKQAYVKAAEVGVAAARAKHAYLNEAVGGNPVVEAKFALETAQAQLDIRKAEVREVEVRIKAVKTGGAAKAAAPAVALPARSSVAVFNMAAVMRDFHKAKYKVYQLNEKRTKDSANLMKWRNEYIKLQQDIQKADPTEKEEMARDMLDLARKVEDEDRKINKRLNDDASRIISGLYDEIQAVVDEAAERHGYEVVFAYPDAVSPEERANPYLKELKLKPPAAQPFFVARRVDITEEVVKALNATYPPLDADGKKVDVNKLPATPAGVLPAAPTPNKATPPIKP